MALDDFDSPDEWRRDLDRRWPERLAMRDRLLDLVVDAIDRVEHPKLLELGAGDGELAIQLHERRERARITAVDRSAVLCDHGRRRQPAVTWVCRDLVEAWSAPLDGPFDVVYSLQTLHDLGGRDVLAAIYRRVADVLASGGVFVHADFVTPMGHDDPARPRRFVTDVHLSLLRAAGFDAMLAERLGLLGCVVARKR